jgi:alkylation response protein AidB-like acyl-CoA dehydrogenase
MDFELSDEQQLLRSGLRELLSRACDVRHVRAVAYDGNGRDDALWQSLVDAGWPALTVPASDGGAGLRFEDLVVVAEEAGRALLPLPLTTTLLAARAIASAPKGQFRSYTLSRIRSGQMSATLALGASGRGGFIAERDGNDWRVAGSMPFVPYGPLAGIVLLEASMPGGGRGLFAGMTGDDDASWADQNSMDRTAPLYELTLNHALVPGGSCLFGEGDCGAAIDGLVDEWRAVLAAETLGASQRMLELSVDYAKERTQFGRAIGTNQAVKWRIADMGGAVERMRAAVYHAAVKIDADAEDRPLAVAMAKAATAAPGAFVGSQAIHVHGGIGYTWEHDLHLYFKRVKSNELLLGDGTESLARVADAVLG